MSNRQEEKDALEDVELTKILDRISYYNVTTSNDELKYINNNNLVQFGGNATIGYGLTHINKMEV